MVADTTLARRVCLCICYALRLKSRPTCSWRQSASGRRSKSRICKGTIQEAASGDDSAETREARSRKGLVCQKASVFEHAEIVRYSYGRLYGYGSAEASLSKVKLFGCAVRKTVSLYMLCTADGGHAEAPGMIGHHSEKKRRRGRTRSDGVAEATLGLAIRAPTEYRSPRPQRCCRFDFVPPRHPPPSNDPFLPYSQS